MKLFDQPYISRLLICLMLPVCWLQMFAIGSAEEPLKIEVQPSLLELRGPRASIQMIVTGVYADGHVEDLTRLAQYTVPASLNIAEGLVTAAEDGTGWVEVVCGQQRQRVRFVVEGHDQPVPVSFRLETLAVLTKQGCNSGSCHGKPNGRGALELSLNAFDPVADERTLIHAPLLRFTHAIEPTESLLLKKPLLSLTHGGGKRLKTTDAAYAILKSWIEEGCQADPAGVAECVKIEVGPSGGRVLHLETGQANAAAVSRPNAESRSCQQVRVVAHFSDGSQRDVTQIAAFSTSNERVARVDEHGLVTGLDRGQTAVVARYLDCIGSTHLTFVRQVPNFAWTDPPENNFVDTLINQKLRQLQYLPSERCDDATFIRRLSLDLRGLLPTATEAREFLSDDRPGKRALWIDRLLESPEMARFWGLRLADLLRINNKSLSEARAAAYSRWVSESIAKNQPYDQFVRELLTSQGKTSEHPAANFFRVTADTNTVTETVAQLFLGSRVMCAQCHNHPYESWTQDNYYQIGAAFHQINRETIKEAETASDNVDKRRKKKTDNRDLEVVIGLEAARPLANPRTQIVQMPWPTEVERKSQEDNRTAFASWLTAPGNPYFARVAVNRIWAQLLGRGLVEPIDDFRSSNPAVNNELLDALAQDFVAAGFDRKHTLRLILNSQTYQRSAMTNAFNADEDLLASHGRIRMLTAEQLQDAIRRVCAGEDQLLLLNSRLAEAESAVEQEKKKMSGDEPTAELTAVLTRRDQLQSQIEEYYMTQQPFPKQTTFLTAFGQPARETACACERREETNLDQALNMMNSELIRRQVQEAAVRFESIDNETFVSELFWAAVSHAPLVEEKQRMLAYLDASSERRQAIEDIVWAVINTNEFIFQH